MDNVKLTGLRYEVRSKYEELPWWIQEYEGIENGVRLSVIVWLAIILFFVLLFASYMGINERMSNFCIIMLGVGAVLFPFVASMNPISVWYCKKYEQEIDDYNEAVARYNDAIENAVVVIKTNEETGDKTNGQPSS